MATEIIEATATIPAGTPANAPVTVDVSFPAMIVERIDWRVPPGPSGLMGWKLTSGFARVQPRGEGTWIVASGESGSWQLDGLHDSGKWEVTGYNTGAFPHTVYVRFLVKPIVRVPEWPRVPLMPLYALTTAADLTRVPDEAFQRPVTLRPPVQYRAPRQ